MQQELTGNAPVSGSAPIVTLVGGTGFLGQYIAQELAREGYRLKIISRNPNAALSVKTIGDLGQFILVRGDVSRPETVARHLAGSHAVISLAGILQERGRQNFSAVHAQGAEKLAQAAKAAGVQRFIHVSALGVDKAVNSNYARTKMVGENAVRNAFPEAVILRPGIVFGPEDHFYNRFAAWGALSPVLPLVGGESKFQPVYVVDVAKAVVECVSNPAMAGKIFELAGPEIYTFRQILDYIVRITGSKARIVSLPVSFASLMGGVREKLPHGLPLPMLTRDQVRTLGYDNVASGNLPGLKELGITPTAAEMVVPDYLRRFNKRYTPLPVAA